MNARPIELTFRFCPACAHQSSSIGAIPFRCEACGFCNFFGPVTAVGGLVTRDSNDLLMVRRARDPGKGKWGLPGGFVDRHETVEQALGREVLEETGLRLSTCQYLMSHPNAYNYHDIIVAVMDLFYVCQVEPDQQIDLDPTELEHFEWVQPSSRHLEHMAFPSNRLAIERWLTRD